MVVFTGATSRTRVTVEPPPQEPAPALGGHSELSDGIVETRSKRFDGAIGEPVAHDLVEFAVGVHRLVSSDAWRPSGNRASASKAARNEPIARLSLE